MLEPCPGPTRWLRSRKLAPLHLMLPPRPKQLAPLLCPFSLAGSVIPDLPAVVKETLDLLYNKAPIKIVDFYASKAAGWWGVSVQIQGTGGVATLLGAFNFIAQEVGLLSISSFQPRFSVAGKLSGNGLPVAIGTCTM
jgi:hypothetical protein